jgi:molecular chaperone DnaK
MSEGSPPPGGAAPPKRPAIGLQIKLACASNEEVKARYGEDLKANRFFIRTKSPRPRETLVRLEAQLSDGTPSFKAAAVVVRVVDPPQPGGVLPPGVEAGMGLQLLAVDDAAREMITALGGKAPQALKEQPKSTRVEGKLVAAAVKPAPGPSQPAVVKVAAARTSDPAIAKVALRHSDPALAKAAPRTSDAAVAKAAPRTAEPPPAKAAPGAADPGPFKVTRPSDTEPGRAPPRVSDPSLPKSTGTPLPAQVPVAPFAPAPPPSALLPQAETPPAPPPAAAPAPLELDFDFSRPAAPPPSAAETSSRPAATPLEGGPPVLMPGAVAGPPERAVSLLEPAPAPGLSIDSAVKGTAKGAGKGPVIGIDLGTTNSCAAVVKNGKPFVIPSREGYNTIPSIVALNDKNKLIIGHPAKGQMLTNPRNTVYGAKRLVGRQFSSQVVADLMGRFQYQIVAGPKGEAAVQLGGQVFSLQQISAMVLGEVKEIAQQYLAAPITRAVITVPAYYNDNQRQAVREAGALAGLEVERILNEPTAAALAFGHGRTLQQRVLIYDLGGGTFDASVLQLQGNVYEVLSTGGDTFLGGVDFDKVLVDHLLSVFKEKNGIDFPGDRVALQRVTDAAERAKIALSETLEYKVRVPFIAMVGDKPYDLEATLSRSELVMLTGHLIDRTLKVCTEVLEAKGLTPKDVDEVLLVGGQSRMPLVRERIRNFFGREPSKAVHPDEAVALGAALMAEQMESGDIGGVVLVDVLPMSIGIGLPGGRYKKIIERNTSLPHKRQYAISTTKDDQPSIELSVFQGESDKAQDNEYLGTIEVQGLPKGPRGSVSFDIQFALSAECLLTVTAQEKGTGRTVTATFSTQDTPEAVRQRLAEEVEAAQQSTALAAPRAEKVGFWRWLLRIFGLGD